jgi:hypothetical protein
LSPPRIWSGGHLDVLEHQFAGGTATHAQLVELLCNRETLHAFLDQECGHTAGAEFRFGLGIHHQGVCIRPVGDPELAAVEQVIPALVLGTQFHRDHIAAGAGLAHGQRTDMLAGDQPGQVLLTLGLGAVALDLVHAQVAVRAITQADRGGRTADLLHGDHVRQVTHARTPVLLADGDAQHTQRAHLRPQVHRELVAAIDLGGTGRDLGL